MHRGDLTNAEWERLQPLLPAQKPRTGRPVEDHRRILNGILWVLRTGAPWHNGMALPARSPAASIAGGKRACGTGSGPCSKRRPTRLGRLTGKFTMLTAPSSVHTSTLLVQKRGPSYRRLRPEPRRLQHQDPSAGGRWRETHGLSRHGGPPPRSCDVRGGNGGR